MLLALAEENSSYYVASFQTDDLNVFGVSAVPSFAGHSVKKYGSSNVWGIKDNSSCV
jgi:hypothetical protein